MWRKKYENTQLFLQVQMLRKYPIDSKAYLGRCRNYYAYDLYNHKNLFV